MTTKTIDVEFKDIREGDYVTLAYKGHEFSGIAWRVGSALSVGTSFLPAYDGRLPNYAFIFAARTVEVRPLPTEPGSLAWIEWKHPAAAAVWYSRHLLDDGGNWQDATANTDPDWMVRWQPVTPDTLDAPNPDAWIDLDGADR